MSALTMADVPLKYRDEDEATLREALALADLVEAEAPSRLVSWLCDGLQSAGDPAELAKAWSTVEPRQGEQAIGAVHVMALRQVHELRKAALWAEAQQARRQAAERELVGAGAGQPQEAGV